MRTFTVGEIEEMLLKAKAVIAAMEWHAATQGNDEAAIEFISTWKNVVEVAEFLKAKNSARYDWKEDEDLSKFIL